MQPEREGCRAASECVVAEGLAVSLDKPLEWAVGFFFGNVELSLELYCQKQNNHSHSSLSPFGLVIRCS